VKRIATILDPQRRRRVLSAAMVVIVTLTVPSRQARTESATTFVFSTGNKSCGEYLRAAEEERKARPVHPEPFSRGPTSRWVRRVETRIFGDEWRGSRTIVAEIRLRCTLTHYPT
jgi:hypothetical protein